MGKISLLLFSSWIFTSCFASSEISRIEKREVGGECEGVKCRDAPEDAGECSRVTSKLSGVNQCCDEFDCMASDGTKSHFSGLSGGGTQGFEKEFETANGKGKMKMHSSSSFSSSSSHKSGPGALKDFKPMDFPKMGGMLPMPSFGKMPSMSSMSDPFKPLSSMPGMPPMPKMPGFGDFPSMKPMKSLFKK